MPLLPTYTGEPILAAIFGGILAGAGLAFIYMRDSSTGGSDFVILAIRKKNPQLSIGAYPSLLTVLSLCSVGSFTAT